MQRKSSSKCEGVLAAIDQEIVQPLGEQGASAGQLAGVEASPAGSSDLLGTGKPEALAAALARIPEKRREHLRVHSLCSILQVTVAAMLAGARSVYAIGQWAAECLKHEPRMLESLGVPAGRCPSVPTLHRVLKDVEAPLLSAVAGEWLAGGNAPRGVSIGIDGKTARGTILPGGSEGEHLVSASVVQTGTVLAQEACDGKGRELPTGKRVLRGVCVDGNVILGDALFMQREVCEDVVGRGGHYLFPVKGNHPQLMDDVRRAFADLGLDEAPKLPQRVGNWFELRGAGGRPGPLAAEELPDPLLPEVLQRQLKERGIKVTAYLDAPRKLAHGRFERREVWVIHDPELGKHAGEAGTVGEPWPHLKQVCRIKRERVTPEGSTVEVSYAATSLGPEEADAQRVATELRDYWACVENRLHYVRDVTLGEDASQVRKGSGAEVMAVLRNVVLGILRLAKVENVAAKLRSLAWRPQDAVSLVLQARVE